MLGERTAAAAAAAGAVVTCWETIAGMTEGGGRGGGREGWVRRGREGGGRRTEGEGQATAAAA